MKELPEMIKISDFKPTSGIIKILFTMKQIGRKGGRKIKWEI